MARERIAEMEGAELVVVNASGCSAHVKTYGELLADDPGWAERAERVAERTRDLIELSPPPRDAGIGTVAVHDACHHLHAQRIEPRAMLRDAGATCVELGDGGRCCGAAGLYSVLQPELAGAAAAPEGGGRSPPPAPPWSPSPTRAAPSRSTPACARSAPTCASPTPPSWPLPRLRLPGRSPRCSEREWTTGTVQVAADSAVGASEPPARRRSWPMDLAEASEWPSRPGAAAGGHVTLMATRPRRSGSTCDSAGAGRDPGRSRHIRCRSVRRRSLRRPRGGMPKSRLQGTSPRRPRPPCLICMGPAGGSGAELHRPAAASRCLALQPSTAPGVSSAHGRVATSAASPSGTRGGAAGSLTARRHSERRSTVLTRARTRTVRGFGEPRRALPGSYSWPALRARRRGRLRRGRAPRPGHPGDPRDRPVRRRRDPLGTDDAPLVPRGPVGSPTRPGDHPASSGPPPDPGPSAPRRAPHDGTRDHPGGRPRAGWT